MTVAVALVIVLERAMTSQRPLRCRQGVLPYRKCPAWEIAHGSSGGAMCPVSSKLRQSHYR
jgi:hypothetical protein